MTAATPGEELRAAAARLRALAEAATPGPWEAVVDDHGRGNVDASIWADSISYYVTEKITSGGRHKGDAAYIAAMGPPVALALADWLAKLADFCDGVERTHGKQPAADNPSITDALAVARALTP